jgi:hypothetical protein
MAVEQITKSCLHCAEPFRPLRDRKAAIYCSITCAARHRKRQTLSEKFWGSVQRGHADECWPWLKSLNEGGYGRVCDAGRVRAAHRVAYELTHGTFDPQLCVLHACDNPKCCNPNHLSLGTQIDNIVDMDVKRRRRPVRGEEHGQSKLTVEQVIAIRLDTRSQSAIGADYGIDQTIVSDIKRRVRWTHVP